MTPERWQQIKEILEATEDQAAGERKAWLDEVCAEDRELLREVESFLVHEDTLPGFIEEPILGFIPSEVGSAETWEREALGHTVGPYRLESLLGVGGMGAVYLARREEDFEQEVALKLIRRDFASPEIIRRFEAERQVLARLEHPHIARLLDGGTTPEGLPWFAMEKVDGLPLDRYCDEHRLTTRERLELFLAVCSALSLAHQNLVIHRDLKPGNILVDAGGNPKLLDFGIAKLLEPDDAPERRAPRTQHHAMTLHYASPEQLRREPIGTASDIYSLGVVLYRLLTGRLPSGLEDASPVDLMLAVCEQEPTLPSTAVRRTEELHLEDGRVIRRTPEDVAAVRDGDPKTLSRRLAGDVDAIVGKALRKEPRHRYASVEQMAADIRDHLEGLPVAARQGDLAYRTGKFIRRHRWGLASAGAMVLLALAFTVALLLQLQATTRARDRAEEISSFLIDLFQSVAPDRPGGAEPTVHDLLDEGREKLEAGLGEQPEVRATLALKLGEVYYKLGDYPAARELLGEAIELLRRLHPGDHPELATALNDLGALCYATGDLPRAEELYRESIAIRRRLGLTEDLLKPMNNLAAILLTRGELDEAEAIYRESLARRLATLGEHHPNVATNLRSLGTVLHARGDLAAAEPLFRQALAIRREVYGPESAPVAAVLSSLGHLEHARGRLGEAEAFFTEALAIQRRELGEEHLETVLTAKDLASLAIDAGETARARELLIPALATLRRDRPPEDASVVEAEGILGALLAAEGKPEEAAPWLTRACEILGQKRGPHAVTTLTACRRGDELRAAAGSP